MYNIYLLNVVEWKYKVAKNGKCKYSKIALKFSTWVNGPATTLTVTVISGHDVVWLNDGVILLPDEEFHFKK